MSQSMFEGLFIVLLALLGIGLYGLLAARHLVRVIIALQVLMKTAMFALIGAGALSGQLQLAQSLALTVIVADTVVVIIGLALAVKLQQQCGSLDIQALFSLRG